MLHTFKQSLNKITKISLTTPRAIILGALIISASHILYGFVISGNNSAPATTTFGGAKITEKDFVTGNKDSDIYLVEYSDTECPYCAQLHPALEKIKQEYKDSVGFVYRYFPLTQIHPNSFEESRAVYCVGTLSGSEKRLAYIDKLFEYKLNRRNMTLDQGDKEKFAKDLGVNMQAFNSCITSQESGEVVAASIEDGVSAGVQGTPSTFIVKRNGDNLEVLAFIDGARPYDYIKAVLDEALK